MFISNCEARNQSKSLNNLSNTLTHEAKITWLLHLFILMEVKEVKKICEKNPITEFQASV